MLALVFFLFRWQSAIFGACGVKLLRDKGADEVKGIQCAPSCEASCNDGEGWPKPDDCSETGRQVKKN